MDKSRACDAARHQEESALRIYINSTTKVVDLNHGVKARIWEGVTESGIPIHCYVTRIAVADAVDKPDVARMFEAELTECRPPTPAIDAIPARLAL